MPQGGNQGLPGSRTTHCPFALFFDPGRTEHARPLRRVGMAPAMTTTKAPTRNPAFEAQSHGFRTRCLRFVPCVATRDAKLASGRWPALPDGLGYPQGCYERFLMLLILLSRAYLAQGHTGFFSTNSPPERHRKQNPV